MNDVDGKNILTCPSCGQVFDLDVLERYCSNCFACTGCERYVCPNCESAIVVKALRKMGEKKN